jgi:ABC-type protease/lipase transport system fused ATPase/permease subunit
MARLRSALVTVFSGLRITRAVAIVAFACFSLLLVSTLHLYWSFIKEGETFSRPDIIGAATSITVVLMIALAFGWLSFSTSGRRLLRESTERQGTVRGFFRIVRVLVASFGMAVGIWLVLIVFSLVVSGPDLVTKMFKPGVLEILTLLCFPIAYKWLD